MEISEVLNQERIFWVQNPNSNIYNDGAYKLKLLNDKVVGVGDRVLVKFNNGNFTGIVKQIAGFGPYEHRAIISVLFPGKKNGTKVYIDNIIDKI
jgi:hypothetical protein